MAASRDEILKRKEAWEKEFEDKQARYEDQKSKYYEAKNAVESALHAAVKFIIGDSGLPIDVDITSAPYGSEGFEVRVSDENDKFNKDKALSWTWKVYLNNDGEVEKESSSWSGMNAVSEANIDYLKKLVALLEKLNNVDWAQILSKYVEPKLKDYITETSPSRQSRPDFDTELEMADIEDAIGKDVLLKGASEIDNRGKPYGRGYYRVLRQSDAFYTIIFIPGYAIQDESDLDAVRNVFESYSNYTPTRIKKSKLLELLNKPIEAIQL